MTYSETDLMQLKELRFAVTNSKKLPEIDLDVLLSNFGGQTVFSVCFDEISFYDYVYKRLEDSEYTEKDGKDKN